MANLFSGESIPSLVPYFLLIIYPLVLFSKIVPLGENIPSGPIIEAVGLTVGEIPAR